jgi:hypothetical protein
VSVVWGCRQPNSLSANGNEVVESNLIRLTWELLVWLADVCNDGAICFNLGMLLRKVTVEHGAERVRHGK